MKKIVTTLLTLTLVIITLTSGCINLSSKINNSLEAKTFYNENDRGNYFTLYPNDFSFIYIELKNYGSQTFDLSKAGNYKIEEDDIFLIASQEIVLRGKIINGTTIVDSEGTKWIKK